jgi:hypothetical protein
MKKVLLFFVLIFTTCFIACKKDTRPNEKVVVTTTDTVTPVLNLDQYFSSVFNDTSENYQVSALDSVIANKDSLLTIGMVDSTTIVDSTKFAFEGQIVDLMKLDAEEVSTVKDWPIRAVGPSNSNCTKCIKMGGTRKWEWVRAKLYKNGYIRFSGMLKHREIFATKSALKVKLYDKNGKFLGTIWSKSYLVKGDPFTDRRQKWVDDKFKIPSEDWNRMKNKVHSMKLYAKRLELDDFPFQYEFQISPLPENPFKFKDPFDSIKKIK